MNLVLRDQAADDGVQISGTGLIHPEGFSNTSAVPGGSVSCPRAAQAFAVTAGGNAK